MEVRAEQDKSIFSTHHPEVREIYLSDQLRVPQVGELQLHPLATNVPTAHRVATFAVHLAPKGGAVIALLLDRASVVLPDLLLAFYVFEEPERVLY